MTPKERIIYLLLLIAPTIGSGTVFFHYVEGWSWVDAYFFSVVTLSTVGYGSLVPVTTVGKIGATVFIIMGLGIFAFVIQQFGKMTAERHAAHSEWLIARIGHHKHAPEPQADNLDDAPDPAKTET
ncbi:potassium channel family protein [Shimia sp. CNT1-13L.2]|uniref:potassium channel family protein n=1 Tax=Shimia sp. CNT1-13L.2 TaxID=2959663 RepID=UPI0020CF2732|nr:potassium channel family protein [Shimia sp. CNT1-13L.2]MCP9482103.1 potassium channel family protein [Shimia sp. CNT1-13L.2]